MFDILIRNATIVDGTGKPGYQGDVAVSDDKIAIVSGRLEGDAVRTIDAKGHIVCPGFIDAHGHSDFTLFVNNRGESKIRQGITTEVTGNCGFTAGPFTEDHKEDLDYYLANTILLTEEQRAVWTWKTHDEFLRYTAKDGLSFNLAPLVGHGVIHVGVMGFEDRMPTDDELDRMKEILRKELDAGLFGLSMAFQYEPGNYVAIEEVLEMCEVVRSYGRIYTIHMRNEGSELLECVSHAIEIAERSGCRVEVSHLKASNRSNWGKARKAMELISEARKRGIDIAFDVYPYTAGGSGLIDLMPPWIKKDGPKVMCERLADEAVRKRVTEDMQTGLPEWDSLMDDEDWDDRVQIATLLTEKNKSCEGKMIREIAAEWGCTNYEAVVRLIMEEKAAVKCLFFSMDEDELIDIMKHPLAVFGTDGRACATYGPLSKGSIHPRYYGSYPRIIGHYVRNRGIMTLEEAIRKSTYAVAKRFGIEGRGEIKEGNFADIVMFSYDDIAENNTFAKPHSYPKGIDFVMVNGQIVIEQGEHTGILPGIILRKKNT